MIDIDSLTEWCARTEVSVDDIRQGEGYLEIRDGHTKVKLKCYYILESHALLAKNYFNL